MLQIRDSYERLRAFLPQIERPLPRERVEETGEALLALLQSRASDAVLCRDVVNVLGDIRYTKAIEALIALAQKEETDSTVKRACVNSLRFFDIAESIKAFMHFLGIHLSPHDKWVRQLAAQNLTTLIRRLRRDHPQEARRHVDALRHVHLNSANTFTRMNAAAVLRLLGDHDAVPLLEARLKKEYELVKKSGAEESGVPFVIREMKKTLETLRGLSPLGKGGVLEDDEAP